MNKDNVTLHGYIFVYFSFINIFHELLNISDSNQVAKNANCCANALIIANDIFFLCFVLIIESLFFIFFLEFIFNTINKSMSSTLKLKNFDER